MTTTPLPPITKHSEPMLKNWPWTEVELAWVAARDAQWQAYATQARADLEAENQRLREALKSLCEYTAELNPNQGWDENDHPAVKMARASLEKQP